MEKAEKIWMNGKFIDWEDAKIHVLVHSLHYGSGIFEGLRCYETEKGPAIFRLQDHMKRLFESAKIYMIGIPYSQKELEQVAVKLVRMNKLRQCYIRPIVFYGYGDLRLNPKRNPVETVIAAYPFKYFGGEAMKKGVRCKISSWCRITSIVLPPQAKSCGNYVNSILANLEAKAAGYDEAILENVNGYVAEGPGENIFLVRDGVLMTPSLDAGILRGITRHTIITLARDMGIPFRERDIPREELFIADEVFLTGTAAEVTPVREVDNRIVGNGKPGPITQKLQKKFFEITRGKDKNYSNWLTPVK